MGVITGIIAGGGAILVATGALPALGFGAAGVTAGSIAAGIQGPATAAGGLFATLQSAGAAGMAMSTQALIGTVVGGVTAIFV